MESDPSVSHAIDGDVDQIPIATDAAEEEIFRVLSLDDPVDHAGAEESESNGSARRDLTDLEITQEDVTKTVANADDNLEDSSRGALVWREISDREREEPPSPSSSGYAGERGSSVGSSGNEDIGDAENGFSGQENSIDSIPWGTGKKHIGEDEASISWRQRKKHFFVLSHSGKPIYSRYGDEHKLAGFSATLQAIISFVEDSGDCVQLVRAGNHQVVFLVKGPIYLVCISCTEETDEALRSQLELIYGQMLVILTKSVNRCFEKNPKFDMTPLLGGTDDVFSSLIRAFSWLVSAFFRNIYTFFRPKKEDHQKPVPRSATCHDQSFSVVICHYSFHEFFCSDLSL